MKLNVSFPKSKELLKTIPHNTCLQAINNNWELMGTNEVKAKSACWLFCWAKTGMGVAKAKKRSIEVFDEIFGAGSFASFDSKVEHEWARFARYSLSERLDGELKSKLDGTLEDDIHAAVSRSQGFMLDSILKKKIELCAMKKAEEYFSEKGYSVTDRSSKCSYDYFCEKDGKKLYVEVKGTQSIGEQVILTKNEVEWAEKNKGNMALFIVSEIKVSDDNKTVSGGKIKVIMPWDVNEGELYPISYNYCISPKNSGGKK